MDNRTHEALTMIYGALKDLYFLSHTGGSPSTRERVSKKLEDIKFHLDTSVIAEPQYGDDHYDE